ncbi:membrane protein [Heyndrickxia sporothermodurans]|nr:membrane protein [Heyndrickxia sporothermodurans]
MNQVLTNKRINALDYIRGFALLGIILVNILDLLNTPIPEPHTIDANYQRFLYLFVEGRFYTIFSFLFGVGFYIFLSRANEKGKNGYVLFIRRLTVLLAFGLIHTLFQPGEALKYYAICGFIVLPFYKVNKHINLMLGLTLIILFCLMGDKLLLTLPLILLGLAAGQYQVFENLSKKTKSIAIFTSIMFLLSGIGLFIQYQLIPESPFQNMILMNEDGSMDQASKFLKMGVAVGPILSAFYIGLLLLLLQTTLIQNLLAPLKYYGRMALTNYLGQTALILLAGNLFHQTANLTYIQTIYFCIAIYAIQIIFSMVWLRMFKMGPFEWLWRMITYWQVPSFINKKTQD